MAQDFDNYDYKTRSNLCHEMDMYINFSYL